MRMEMREREIMEQGLEQGREEGLETGIRGTVSVLKKMNVPIPNILSNIQEEYGLTLETAKKYV